MRARQFRFAMVPALVSAMVWAAFAAETAPPAAGPAVATVGDMRISKAEFEQRANATLDEYRTRSGGAVPDEFVPIVRRQVLEGLIRMDLLALEASRRGALATVAEAEDQIRKEPFFNPGGQFDANKFNTVRSINSPAWQSAILELRRRIGAQKLSRKLEQERGPAPEELRAAAERALTRASFDYLLMRGREFGGDYPEPRESEVLDYYRTHPSEFQRPDRVTLSVVFFDRPSPSDEERADPVAMRRWDARQKTSADSALAALRGGASFDALAEAVGGVRHDVTVTRGSFPAFWQGSAEQNASVFQQKVGGIVPSTIPGNPGYLIARVDAVRPAQVARLSEVSRAIRQRLRGSARERRDERELRPIYDALADSLRGPAMRVRYAVADTTTLEPGSPSEADLDRFYRGHLADYSRFDAASSTIQSSPLAEVRDDVRLRWIRDRKVEVARGIIEGLQRAWSQGRRDPALEKSASLLREVGPIPVGAPVDTGLAGAVITDSLMQRGAQTGVGVAPFSRGVAVYHVFERLADVKPSFEQARPRLRALFTSRKANSDEVGARALFESNPSLFAAGKLVHFSRVIVEPLDARNVPLTRAEVERYYRKHFDRYSAPEIMGARHILISPTGPGARADQEARARADSVYQLVKNGADFATLAQRLSDDPATRARGGDLGDFGRGAMLDEFERAVFAMQPGDVSPPVRTEVGYHIIKCTNHLPVRADPLKWVYPTVGYDAALEKADSIAIRRADSLFRVIRTPAQARLLADRLHYNVVSNTHAIGEEILVPDLVPYFRRLELMKPGELYPKTIYLKGIGGVITWVDSISPAAKPTWQDARDVAIEVYRSGSSTRSMLAKRAELDSMLASGWTLDSLAALWGGLTRAANVSPAAGISDLGGGKGVLDSLTFGARGGRALREGETSGWLTFPVGYVRMRLAGRIDPNPGQLAARIQNDRSQELERRLRTYFEDLKDRYPVRILDPKLRDVGLPPPPAATVDTP